MSNEIPPPRDLSLKKITIVHTGLVQLHLVDDKGERFESYMEPGEFFTILGEAYQDGLDSYMRLRFGTLLNEAETSGLTDKTRKYQGEI